MCLQVAPTDFVSQEEAFDNLLGYEALVLLTLNRHVNSAGITYSHISLFKETYEL